MSRKTDSGFVITPTSEYGYIPTLWVCIIFLSLFGVSTIIHLAQALFIKPRFYWIIYTFVLCGVGELVGWSGRLWSSVNSENPTPYLMQITTTIISPVFLTAALYNILAHIIRAIGEEYSRIRPKTYVWIFVTIDVISLVIQAAGGGIAASSDTISASNTGGDIILVGIIFQLVSLMFFIVLGIEVIYRYRSKKPLKTIPVYGPTGSSLESIPFVDEKTQLAMPQKRINKMIVGLCIATILVVIRSFYRTAELADGWHGAIIRTQVYFNVFDATAIVLAMLTMNLFSPAFLLRP